MGITTARRTWNIERDGRTYHVEMEDEYFFGRRVVRVNGQVAYAGRTILSDHSGAYQFDLGGRPAFLKISTNGIRYFYDLITDAAAAEIRTRAATANDLRQEPPGLGNVALGLVGALLFSIALVFGFDGRAWREPIVAVAGVPINAHLLRAFTTRDGAHEVEYSFAVAGRTFSHRTYLPIEEWEAARASGLVAVRYLAVFPEVNGAATALSDLFWLAVIGLFLGAVVAVQLRGVASELHDIDVWRRIEARGLETTGRVTRVANVRNRYMIVTGCTVRYAYVVAGSNECRGDSRRLPLAAAIHYPVGGAVRVRYDPERPQDSMLVTSPPAAAS